MNPPPHRDNARDVSRTLYYGALAALALVIATLAVTSVWMDSATADEGAHIAAGLVKLRHGWLSFFSEQPPLMNVISAIPLGEFRLTDSWRAHLGRRGHWAAGHALLYRSGNDPHRLLFLARLPSIALLLALCFAVAAVVTMETDRRWGTVAFVLTGFCPNLLAHGRLATVDIGVTAFSFFAFALLLRALRASSIAFGALAGLAGMCAILSKTSGAIVVPFLTLLALLHAWRTKSWWRAARPALAGVVAAVATLYVVIFALVREPYLAMQFPDAGRIAIPWLQYKLHVDAIRFWYAQGHEHTQFLMGEFSRTGFPHYYVAAFLLKTPVAAIVLTVMAGVAALRRRSLAADAALLFIVLFMAVTFTSRIALGLRYALPIFPFLYTFIAISLARVTIDRRRTVAVAALVVWFVGASVAAWPNYISYFNEATGSHRNADRLLIDSNLDWGQDLRRLERWTREQGIDSIRIDYFGGGDIEHLFGDRAERWTAPRPQPLPKGWFALSRHLYRASFDPTESPVDYDTYLEASNARYVTTIGGSIDVYRVE